MHAGALMTIIAKGEPGDDEIAPSTLVDFFRDYGLEHIRAHVRLKYSATTFNSIRVAYERMKWPAGREKKAWVDCELRAALIEDLSNSEKVRRKLLTKTKGA